MSLNVLWLQSGGCGGCSMSLLCADSADFPALLTDNGIHLLWHPSLSLENGRDLLGILQDCLNGRTRLDALCIEGAVLRGPNRSGRFHLLAGTDVPMMHWIEQLATVATHVLAVGSCAAWGGISASGSNPADACGLQYEDEQIGGLLGRDFCARGGLPVVNIAGCPTHPGWVLDTLMMLAADQFGAPELDPLARPRVLCRPVGAPRLPAQRVLRVQSQRGAAHRPGLPDGEHGLQGNPGPRRLQHPALERRWQLPARRLCLHQMHRTRLSEPRPRLSCHTQTGGHPGGAAHRHAQSLVCGTGLTIQKCHPQTCQSEFAQRPRGVATRLAPPAAALRACPDMKVSA